jgi:F-type H+-transporting ATPase subunit a
MSELPNIITLLARRLKGGPFAGYLLRWEDVIFSGIVIGLILLITFLARRKISTIPGRLQSACELYVELIDDFVCGVIGPKGRQFVPFIGTLFIYILFMNLFGLIPLMKSPTSNWSTTLALALCVFVYVQYCSFRELGFKGYMDHLAGNPRGILAYFAFVPLTIFVIHVVAELVRPISLSLRLRSNIWGDDALLAVVSGFGLSGVPLLIFSTVLTIIASLVQALVFSLLTTIYFALVLVHPDEEHSTVKT